VDENAQTMRRRVAAQAMLVALPPELAGVCTEVLGDTGYRVVAVAHVPAACERMPVMMPLVVVAEADLQEDVRRELADQAVAIGAAMLFFPRHADAAFVGSAVRMAARQGLAKI
jgi:hypothetical protein